MPFSASVDDAGLELLTAIKSNDSKTLGQLLTSGFIDKISPDYLGLGLLLLNQDSHFEWLQMLMKVDGLGLTYFEEAVECAANAYQIKVLQGLLKSKKAHAISSSLLSLALRKTAETGLCLSEVLKTILELEEAKEIPPNEISLAFQDAIQRNDSLAIRTFVSSPLSEKILDKDLAEAFTHMLCYEIGDKFVFYGETTRIWNSIKMRSICDNLFTTIFNEYRGNGPILERFMQISINDISQACLVEALCSMVEDRRISALQVILKSKRASKEISDHDFDKAFQNASIGLQVNGMDALLNSNKAAVISTKSLYLALTLLATRNKEACKELGRNTNITAQILKLPKAQELSTENLDYVFRQAFEKNWQEVVEQLLDSSLWKERHP